MIQTHYPEEVLLQKLIKEGYAAFANELLRQRKDASMPPFSYFCLIRAEDFSLEKCRAFLTAIKATCPQAEVLGPAAALMAKRKGLHCQQLLIRSHSRRSLQAVIKDFLNALTTHPQSSAIKWVIDVDPIAV